MDQIDRVRAFNRLYLRELGLLDRSYLGSGMGVTEVRVLYELAHGNDLTARALTTRLAIDEGYLSRILRRFAAQAWLERHPTPGDARSRSLVLTATGRAMLERMEARSRADIAARLGPLTPEARAALTGAMDSIGHLLGADPQPVTLRGLIPGDAGWIISRHGALYAAEEGYDASFEALVAEILAAFLRDNDPASERGWIAERGGQRLGSIFCVRQSNDDTAKLRLFLLEPAARGLGLGKWMLEECIRFAQAVGYRRMVLWTHASHQAACALYRQRGFTLTSETPAHAFGCDVIDQTWTLEFQDFPALPISALAFTPHGR